MDISFINRTTWIQNEKLKGIEFLEGYDTKSMFQKDHSYVLIYSEQARQQNSRLWQNNLDYFHRILTTVKTIGDETIQFYLQETEEQIKPTIYYYKNGSQVSQNFISDLYKRYVDEDPSRIEELGLENIANELRRTPDYPNPSNLNEWIDLFELNGAINLGEFDSRRKLGNSFVLIITQTKEHQSSDERLVQLKLFLKCLEEKESKIACLIMEIPTINSGQVAVNIQQYSNDICVTKNLLTDRRLGTSEQKTDHVNSPIDLLLWIDKFVKKGATYLGVVDVDWDFDNSTVLSLSRNPVQQSTETKLVNLNLFLERLELREDFLIVETADFKSLSSLEQTIVIKEYREGRCVCEDVSAKTAAKENNHENVSEYPSTSRSLVKPTYPQEVEELSVSKWILSFIQAGAQYLSVFDDFENYFGDGVILFVEKNVFQTVEEQMLNLTLFQDSLDESKSPKSKFKDRLWVAEIEPKKSNFSDDVRITIRQYEKNRCISKSLLADKSTNLNLASCGDSFEAVVEKPVKKSLLQIPCPCDFSTKKVDMMCSVCHTEIYFGFDDYLYCNCGRSYYSNYWFKCKKESHGQMYLSHRDERRFLRTLNSFKPIKNLNILLLGETGVGKSTLINAFANYTSFSTLQEANESELKVLIPTSFVVTTHEYREQEIQFGTSQNEVFGGGKSSTQNCICYRFSYGCHDVTLIDTPGIGDTRGSDQDRKNFEKILAFIANFDTIDGICILLKPNESRLSVVFRYCIVGLLSHLHKNASRNITFVFTNARSTFYRPGESLPLLRTLLSQIKVKPPFVDIPLSHETIYCFDNEAFRFLVAYKQQIKFTEKDKRNYEDSWEGSVTELERLLNYITNLAPHSVRDTLTINGARRIIVHLSQPLCEITQNIANNIALLEDRKRDIKLAGDDIVKLRGCLHIPIIDLEIAEQSQPRTVCTSAQCIEVISTGGQPKVHYKTVCHSPCQLLGVKPDVINNSDLLECWAIVNENCQVCSCRWESHMHIRYDTKQVNKTKVDPNIQSELDTKEQRKQGVERTIKELEVTKQKHLKEKDIITKACAKFATFLSSNAITPYNDAVYDYLDYMIRNEEMLSANCPNKRKVIEELRKSQQSYLEEKSILDKMIKAGAASGSNKAEIGPQDITSTINQLKNLELNGSYIMKILDTIDKVPTQENHNIYVKGFVQTTKNYVANQFKKIVPHRFISHSKSKNVSK